MKQYEDRHASNMRATWFAHDLSSAEVGWQATRLGVPLNFSHRCKAKPELFIIAIVWQYPLSNFFVSILHHVVGCMRAASTWRPWVSGLVGHFVQTWPDSELLSHSAVLRL